MLLHYFRCFRSVSYLVGAWRALQTILLHEYTLKMMARLYQRDAHGKSYDTTAVGYLLDYRDPFSLSDFARPPSLKLHVQLLNLCCGSINYKLCFFSIDDNSPFVFWGYLNCDDSSDLTFCTEANSTYFVDVNSFETQNAYILEQYEKCSVPVVIPMLWLRNEDSVCWEFSKLMSGALKGTDNVALLREWFGFLVLIHARTTADVIRITKIRKRLQVRDIMSIVKGVNDKLLLLKVRQKRTGVFWLYYPTPKPPNIQLWVQGLMDSELLTRKMVLGFEACCSRHEGFYRVLIIEEAGKHYIRFDDGVEDISPVCWTERSNWDGYEKHLLYYQPLCSPLLRIGSKSEEEDLVAWGYLGENQDVPVYLFPGQMTVSDIRFFGPVRSDITESWSIDWLEKYGNFESK